MWREPLGEAAFTPDFAFIDLNLEFQRGTDSDWWFVDRVHLTDQGYRIAAAAIARAL